MTADTLLSYAEEKGYKVDYRMLQYSQSLSIPFDGGCVCLDPTKIETSADELERLAHEIGHCETDAFYSPSTWECVGRMERKAEKWAIKKLVPKNELIGKLKGNRELWEIAEHFGVSCKFLIRAIQYYEIQLHPSDIQP